MVFWSNWVANHWIVCSIYVYGWIVYFLYNVLVYNVMLRLDVCKQVHLTLVWRHHVCVMIVSCLLARAMLTSRSTCNSCLLESSTAVNSDLVSLRSLLGSVEQLKAWIRTHWQRWFDFLIALWGGNSRSRLGADVIRRSRNRNEIPFRHCLTPVSAVSWLDKIWQAPSLDGFRTLPHTARRRHRKPSVPFEQLQCAIFDRFRETQLDFLRFFYHMTLFLTQKTHDLLTNRNVRWWFW